MHVLTRMYEFLHIMHGILQVYLYLHTYASMYCMCLNAYAFNCRENNIKANVNRLIKADSK